MLSYKSSPLIEEHPSGQRSSNRSKRSSTQRNSNDYEFQKVANPFRAVGQENALPPGLLQEIGNLEFISAHQVQGIAWQKAVYVPRRSSVFARHLQNMQRAAREQAEKASPFVSSLKKGGVRFAEMEEERSGSGSAGVSVGALRGEEGEMEVEEERAAGEAGVQFYSLNSIGEELDWDGYFNA
jgi:hypothetical protein